MTYNVFGGTLNLAQLNSTQGNTKWSQSQTNIHGNTVHLSVFVLQIDAF